MNIFISIFVIFIRLFLHYLFCWPLKIYLSIITVLEFISWLKVDFIVNISDAISFPGVAEKVGFTNGFAPIASFHNLFLFFIAIFCSFILLLPLIILNVKNETKKQPPLEKFANRMKLGERFSKTADFAGLLLLFISVYVFLNPEIASPKLPSILQWTVIALFGATLGVDNLKYSNMGENLGMPPLLGKRKALKNIATEIGILDSASVNLTYENLLKAVQQQQLIEH